MHFAHISFFVHLIAILISKLSIKHALKATYVLYIKSKKDSKDQESIQPSKLNKYK